jgi:hypothetical protein
MFQFNEPPSGIKIHKFVKHKYIRNAHFSLCDISPVYKYYLKIIVYICSALLILGDAKTFF